MITTHDISRAQLEHENLDASVDDVLGRAVTRVMYNDLRGYTRFSGAPQSVALRQNSLPQSNEKGMRRRHGDCNIVIQFIFSAGSLVMFSRVYLEFFSSLYAVRGQRGLREEYFFTVKLRFRGGISTLPEIRAFVT